MMESPTIIYSCKGITHLCYAIWSIRSLQRFNYQPIEVIVSNEKERNFFASHCPGVLCNVVDVELQGYPDFSYKPFVLTKYLNKTGIQQKGRDIVICDADVLWKKDPILLFKRLKGTNWVQKITAVNPMDYEIAPERVPLSNIGLRTINNYAKRSKISIYPNFIVNAGLFMLGEKVFPEMVNLWMDKILRLPPKEMLMSEALMSLTYTEMGLHPVADRENIKYLGMEKTGTVLPILGFEVAPPCPDGFYIGYETAKHYYGDQRGLFHKDAVSMGLDYDNLNIIVKRGLFFKNIKRLPKIPGRIIDTLKGVQTRIRDNTIYYIVDNTGWVQHTRFKYLKRYIGFNRLRLLSAKGFRLLWKLGFLRNRPIYFSTWRIAHAFIKEDPHIFADSDFQHFMAAVTSHSNIGGGLNPHNPIPGREPKEAFDLAISLLKKFKIVSVNSMLLYELLNGSLSNLFYSPNGVDTAFFTPKENKEYNPRCIRIGWVGRVRGPKNLPVIEAALKELESTGIFEADIIKVSKGFKRKPRSFEEMRKFYRNIDFYLCASWNEGTPNPALEAGACGLPIVTTCVGNMRELIRHGENGFFIEPTVESIISQFEKIGKMNKDRYYQMSGNIRSSILEDWSWKKRAKNFALAFDRLLSS